MSGGRALQAACFLPFSVVFFFVRGVLLVAFFLLFLFPRLANNIKIIINVIAIIFLLCLSHIDDIVINLFSSYYYNYHYSSSSYYDSASSFS